MKTEDILRKLPPSGFLKVARENSVQLSPENRAALIRRGNEFFNRGQTELARRVFLTTRYSDGLIRVGDRYVKAGKPVEAMAAYMTAPCPQKAEALAARMAGVLSHWLKEGRGSEST
jgi:hypothetical protein